MKRILIVDDNHDQLGLLTLVLGKHYQVRTTASLTDFLNTIAEEIPDLILQDMHVGPYHAVDFKLQLENRGLPSIPIILISGDERTHEYAEELGCAAALVKPFSLTDLLFTIRTILPDQGR